MEAVWLQDFASRMPGYPDIGPCIVIKGKQPCCGLLPATHMTDNCHVSIPLRAMSKVGSSCCVHLQGLASWLLGMLAQEVSYHLLLAALTAACQKWKATQSLIAELSWFQGPVNHAGAC
jgi:hypothetical protein